MSSQRGEEDHAAEEERGRRTPLLAHDHDSSILILHQDEDTIVPLPPDHKPSPSLPVRSQRLVSLDVFRGLTVAVRPQSSISPQFNCQLAA